MTDKGKRFIILVEVDAGAEVKSSSSRDMGEADHDARLVPEGEQYPVYRVKVTPNKYASQHDTQDLVTSAAHELGHVLQRALDLPVNKQANETLQQSNSNVERQQAVVAVEREAWDIGRLIYPQLDEVQAEKCIRSYEDAPADEF